MKIFFFLLFFVSCSSFITKDMKSKLSQDGYHIVIDCSIFDLDGKIIKAYPGLDCVFEDDGSFISYDPEKFELTRFDKDLKKLWSLKIHLHHQVKKMGNGDYLVNSSEFKPFGNFKKVRFDRILKVSKDGKIINEFSYYKYLLSTTWAKSISPFKTSWDENLGDIYEFTHLASSYEVPYDVFDGKITYPKGSIVVTMNGGFKGITIVDPSFQKVMNYVRVSHNETIHDGQFTSPSEIMFFKNTTYLHPISLAEKASVKFYDVFNKKIKEEIYLDLYALFTGGAQLLESDILFISDSNSGQKITPSNFIELNEWDVILKKTTHSNMKSRAIFYNRKTKQVEQLHFDFSFKNAKLEKLTKFLELNKGI